MRGSPEGRVVVVAVWVAGDATKRFLSVGVLVRGVSTVVVKYEIGRGCIITLKRYRSSDNTL